MRSFNANFVTEKNKRSPDGPTPVNLVSFDFTTPVYLSDRTVTPSGGSAHSGLVKGWSFVDTSVAESAGAGIDDTIEVVDIDIVIINSETTRFSDNFTAADPPENVDVELSYWMGGTLYSEREVFFKGRVHGQPEYDESDCRLRLRGIFEKYNKLIGEDLIISADDYASADPDDIGKMRNICIGTLPKVPCRSLVAGVIDTLKADITDSATSFYVSLAGKANFPSGTVTSQIDSEKIQGTYTPSTGQFTSCTRGYNSTTAAAHDKGAKVAEILTEYVQEVAGHPVDAIAAVYVEDPATKVATLVDPSDYTAYTGQTGDEKTGYEGTAVVAISALPQIVRQVNIAANDTIAVNDTIGVSTGSHTHTVDTQIHVWRFDSYSETGGIDIANPQNCIDGDLSSETKFTNNYSTCYLTLSKGFYEEPGGSVSHIRLCMRVNGGNAARMTWGGRTLSATTTGTHKSSWYSDTSSWSTINSRTALVYRYSGGTDLYIGEAWIEIKYAPTVQSGPATGVAKTGSASKSGTVTLTGNSVADTVIGGRILADVDGAIDDGSGSYTGTPSALVERPDHVFKYLWNSILGASLSDLTIQAAASTYYSTNSFKFAVLVNAPVQADARLTTLALQCRSRFFVSPAGTATLLLRDTGQTSGHSIAKNEIRQNSFKMRRSQTDNLVNLFNIRFEKDLTRDTNDPGNYLSSKPFSDTTSITRYGQREWRGDPSVFCFDAVRDSAMAVDVGNFLKTFLSVVRKIPLFQVFLDNCEIEPGDIIDVTHDLDSLTNFVCEVLRVQYVFGSAQREVLDRLEIEAVEN